MQVRGLITRLVIFAGVAISLASAQQQTGTNGGQTGGATTGNTGGNTTGSTGRTNGTITTPNQNPNDLGQRPIFLSGKVVTSDGSPLNERAKIERVCGGTVKLEAYTDSKGRFNFEVGRNFEMPDASSGGPDLMNDGGFRGRGGLGNATSNMNPERQLWGCELRANLAGFRSDMVSLANVHYMDNPDLGTIILHRLAKVDGLTVSATTSLAPKDARKAYEKALEAVQKKNPDAAQAGFEKAVGVYPRYAAAWVGLGKVQEQRDHNDEAKKAYQQAIAADDKYIEPYERLAMLALKENNWEGLANSTAQFLRLDPFNNPNMHYLNGVANFQLKKYDLAEKSELEAIRLDSAKQNPRSTYVLGLVQAQKQDFDAAAVSLRSFLAAAPTASDADNIRKQLSQVEEFAKQKALQSKQ
jgi:tetratricopeptide (TPR) repeat protein